MKQSSGKWEQASKREFAAPARVEDGGREKRKGKSKRCSFPAHSLSRSRLAKLEQVWQGRHGGEAAGLLQEIITAEASAALFTHVFSRQVNSSSPMQQ
jgi:hypothetical protein